MQRRDFLKLPLAVAAFTSMARAATSVSGAGAPATSGFRVGAQQDRDDASLSIMGGRFDLKVSGKDTGGELCIYDTFRSTKGGPPLHRHYSQDEWFFVIQGQFIAKVGEQTVVLQPGDSAFAPRQIPHSFAMTGDGPGHMLVLFQPAGSMEDFFHQMSVFGKGVSAGTQMPKEIWEQHGMELLGPPLKF